MMKGEYNETIACERSPLIVRPPFEYVVHLLDRLGHFIINEDRVESERRAYIQ
jgi:hypothetical protein